jgi:hypothetical protein
MTSQSVIAKGARIYRVDSPEEAPRFVVARSQREAVGRVVANRFKASPASQADLLEAIQKSLPIENIGPAEPLEQEPLL